MSKSTSKWLWLGVPVGVVAVGSVAVAMGFWIHPAADHAATDRARSATEDTITRSDAAALIEPMQPAPFYRLPDFALIGRYSHGLSPAPAWDPSAVAGPFPRIEDRPGPVARSSLRNPGVTIRGTTLARKRERVVPTKTSPSTLPQVVATAPLPNTLASELKDRRRDIDRCAGKQMVVGGAMAPPTGKIAVRWVVRADGSSSQVQVQENTVDDKKLSKCVLNTVHHWRFSPPTEGDAHVQSTFVFL